MRYISLGQTLEIHRRIVEQAGGTPGILNPGAFESALQQPRMTFGGEYLYPTLAEKAAAPAFSIIRNHPFIDENKRTGHAATVLIHHVSGSVLCGWVHHHGLF